MPNRQDCRFAQPEAAPKGCGTRLQDITLEIILCVVFGVADESRLVRLRAAIVETLGLFDVGNPLRPIRARLRRW